MVTVVRRMSACLSPLPNTFFEVLPLLLPMAGGGGSSQLSEFRIQNSEFRSEYLGKWRAFPGAKTLSTVSMRVGGRRNDRSISLTTGN
jgi:hypothetical protein